MQATTYVRAAHFYIPVPALVVTDTSMGGSLFVATHRKVIIFANMLRTWATRNTESMSVRNKSPSCYVHEDRCGLTHTYQYLCKIQSPLHETIINVQYTCTCTTTVAFSFVCLSTYNIRRLLCTVEQVCAFLYSVFFFLFPSSYGAL